MAEAIKTPREQGDQSLYIDGYFSKRIWNGETPKYGYPGNHVPEVGTANMEVVTGFITAYQAESK